MDYSYPIIILRTLIKSFASKNIDIRTNIMKAPEGTFR